jgi:hypothetical protein
MTAFLCRFQRNATEPGDQRFPARPFDGGLEADARPVRGGVVTLSAHGLAAFDAGVRKTLISSRSEGCSSSPGTVSSSTSLACMSRSGADKSRS